MSVSKRIWYGILAIAPIPLFGMYIYSFFQLIPNFLVLEELEAPPTEFFLHFGKLFIYIALAGILSLVGMIIFILDVVKNKKFQGANSNLQVVWILIIILLSTIGILVYYFVEIIPRKENENYSIPLVTDRTN